MDPVPRRLVEAVRDECGGALRALATGVASPGDRSYDLAYARDEISEGFSEEDREEILDDLILENLHSSRTEELYRAGRPEALSRIFEDGIVLVVFPPGDGPPDGVFVSLDRDAGDCLVRLVDRVTAVAGEAG